MIKRCEFCPEWAQWRMIDPTDARFFLCGTHKQEMDDKVKNIYGYRFTFIGAAPGGLNCS